MHPNRGEEHPIEVQVIAAAWEVIRWKRDEVKGQAPGVLQFSAQQAEGQRQGEKVGKGRAGIVEGVTAARLAAMATSWCPISQVVVKGAPVTITLNVPEPKEIWPTLPGTESGGKNEGRNNVKENIVVRVTRDGASVEGHSVSVGTKLLPKTGGHQHTGEPPTSLLGEFKNMSTGKRGKGSITGETDNDGELKLEFTAPEFSGKLEFTAKSITDKSEAKGELTVKVPNLVAFSGSGEYQLKGDLPEHPDNHYLISQTAIQGLIEAANKFAKQKWNTTGKMRFNDMSLESGGLFDLNKTWTADKGHQWHRIGRSVDIENLKLERIKDKSPTTGKDTSYTRPNVMRVKQFAEFMETKITEWEFIDEGQTREDAFERTKKYPHFEWKGK